MSVVLRRRHRLLHVRALLARRNGGETRNLSSTLLDSQLLHQERADPTATVTGRRKGITSTSSRINSKRSVGNDDTQTFTIDLFVDTWFRKTMIELGRTEEVCREMDKLANEDHTHIATEEELNVYRSNWWIRSNFGWFCTRCP